MLFYMWIFGSINPEVPEDVLRKTIYTSDVNDFTRCVVANNPNCPSDVLSDIKKQTSNEEVIKAIRNNSNSPKDLIDLIDMDL